ncbi:RluA family pseudouridine synthase [Candidatus Parcubacteria bacterium]|nr:RluA family pseudouridine synthase [Candidatus Parcubacteria bacterium]
MKTAKLTNSTPQRLDSTLAGLLGISRARMEKIIKQGNILVNKSPATKKTMVTKDDKVEYDPKLISVKKPKIEKKKINLEILYEDKDVMVVNKPAGLLIHQTESSNETTLFDLLEKKIKHFSKIGDNPLRGGIVHRLDKMTSGVLIVAKTQKAFEHLKAQFKNRAVQKKYSTLVHGTMDKKHDTIALSIERSKTTGRMAAKPVSQGGKEAITHYTVAKQYPHHALLDVMIETGRTNQIRAHMFAIKHPVVGDKLYKQKFQKLLDIGRTFLHARELTITLPNGQRETFSAPLPDELEQVLKMIPKI